MQLNLPRFTFSEQMIIALIGILFLLLIISQPALASSTTTAGGLPFDSWFTKIRDSITGPFAFTASIVGLVGAGAALIFGGDMNGFLRTLIFIVLVLCFIVAANTTLQAITGTGAEIALRFNDGTDRLLFRWV
ncbi:Type IV secretory pathway, VirB2 components (pilins) [Candidatus Regiella insecticola 5.15]|uniref:Type IV secretory pathway, VirB2 components (Pilins) n=1 Tax=Candidatus Regiella insecticola 5.15 TaxID=1005043 RepID=G2GYV8_9ENTR|nr:TrbC/VirB2 family protein [Candidatus Regiella insecticola]EGY29071.1 Type IV secretory pathway, VirB2 components (pilins) [Candidatus Regiella insecticola 5.15]